MQRRWAGNESVIIIHSNYNGMVTLYSMKALHMRYIGTHKRYSQKEAGEGCPYEKQRMGVVSSRK